MVKILTLDVGITTGICVIDEENRIHVVTSMTYEVFRAELIERKMLEIVDQQRPDLVVVEWPADDPKALFYRRTQASIYAWQLILQSIGDQFGIDRFEVTPSQWKSTPAKVWDWKKVIEPSLMPVFLNAHMDDACRIGYYYLNFSKRLKHV